MKCPSCGSSLNDAARFCGVCGARLGASKQAVAAPSQVERARPAAGLPPALTGEPRDPYLGKTLNNRFHVESKLGEGGFGAVYRATQLGIDRSVALKLLHPEMSRDKNLVARFRREGKVLCSLRDAHTITTFDFDQTPDGTLYIAMELLEGKSLHDVFHDEAPITWQRMLKIVSQMCSSLAEAHQLGIVHRDLKPENINLEVRPGDPEFVKILDFGIAKLVRGDGLGNSGGNQPQLTATGQTLGTLEYMSPEQLMGKDLDGRSDIYAVGVLTYEMCTGQLPFPDAVGPAALISAQLRKVPMAPSVACPEANIPPGVDALVLKMLEKTPKGRFKDVVELRQACEQVLASGGQVPAIAANNAPPEALVPPTMVARGSGESAASSGRMHMGGPVAGTPQIPPTLASSGNPGGGSDPSQSMGMGMGMGMVGPSSPRAGTDPARALSTDPVMYASSASSKLWLWVALGIVVVGGAIGAILALT